ncbi:hypothetical protein [Streptomyces vinaceus]|nr:hypothetical protein [Streptomyces vinaceus]
MAPLTTGAAGCLRSVGPPAEREACADFVRTMLERGGALLVKAGL